MDTVVLPVLLRLHREKEGFERLSVEWNQRVGAMARIVDMVARDFGDRYLLAVMNKFKERTGGGIPMDISHTRRLVGLGVQVTKVHEALAYEK
jgi:hypothetical protein